MARRQADKVTLAPHHWQDEAQHLPSSNVTVSEQFVTVPGVAEFPNVIKIYYDLSLIHISEPTRHS